LLPPVLRVAGERSVSLYDQLLVAQGGGLELGAILFLFGGVATLVVVAIVGLTRGERPSLRAFLAGAVAAWSLTWLGSLLRAANLRDNALSGRLSLEVGFWLQAVSIGVAVIGTSSSLLDARTPTNGVHRAWTRDAGHSTKTYMTPCP
jgi:ABC-type Co2+ transport system permease subunit